MANSEEKEHIMISDPELWVDAHGDYLFRYAMLRVRDPELAEEVVQETFLGALQNLEKFKGRSSERTWLVGILKNKIVDHFRKSSREKAVGELEPDRALDGCFNEKGAWKEIPQTWRDSPEAAFERKEFWKAFTHCLSQLPEKLARAFTLVEIDQLNSEEVSKVLNITPTYLWVMLHRARLRLRNCLDGTWFKTKGNS